jgi:lipopolysaccharide/colanic/teichoic acid biosynthesis glycosyltransferase
MNTEKPYFQYVNLIHIVGSMKQTSEEQILSQQPAPVKYNKAIIYPDKVCINQEYMKHQSFSLDLKIIIYTVPGRKLEVEWIV